jgi:hypothetical protein
MIELLREEYARSVSLLGSPTLEDRGKPEERLGEHLLTYYWHGKLDLHDPLLDEFFSRASDTVRGHSLSYLGRSLRNADGPISPDVIQRLKALWEWRVELSSRPKPEDHIEEMSAFGWWFVSNQLDEAWALHQLEASLKISGKVDIDHEVVGRLADLAPNYPNIAVRCLRLMIEGAREAWRIHHWSGHAESVLSAGLRSGDEDANQTARAVINRLAARGFLQFGQLLADSQ